MANLIQWSRPSSLSLRRDIEEVFDELAAPRGLRREMDRLFEDFSSPRSLWREMDRLMDEFDSPPRLSSRIGRIFESFLGEGSRRSGTFVPSVELQEQDNEYLVKADLPGMREQDIDIQVTDDNMLIVSGERRHEEKKRARGYEYSERSYGSFSRTVQLPAGVDTSKIEADFRNGVLELRVPKGEAARGRKIPLSSGREEPRVISAGDGSRGQTQNQAQRQDQQRQDQQRQDQQQRGS